jgi:hypothetical protein
MSHPLHNALQPMLLTLQDTCALIESGAHLTLAADEAVLAALPCGAWIGGTIPYFMGQDGGSTSRQHVFVTPTPRWEGLTSRIVCHDTATLSQVCVEAPDNGYSVVIMPAFSDIHMDYAQRAALYDDMFMKPIVGWIAGIHLDDMGQRSPKVRDGRYSGLLDNAAVVMHVALPPHTSADVAIVNLFRQDGGDVIEFDHSGFEASTCRVNGETTSLVAYLQRVGHDTRLPLVADYSGASINVSIKAVDTEHDRVAFYAPVFRHVRYQRAQGFAQSYDRAFQTAVAQVPAQAQFACNCVLNYLYGELEGKRTGHVTGPMTFGEIAYVLLNQTLVHLTLRQHY